MKEVVFYIAPPTPSNAKRQGDKIPDNDIQVMYETRYGRNVKRKEKNYMIKVVVGVDIEAIKNIMNKKMYYLNLK